jgi:hypothetical protein
MPTTSSAGVRHNLNVVFNLSHPRRASSAENSRSCPPAMASRIHCGPQYSRDDTSQTSYIDQPSTPALPPPTSLPHRRDIHMYNLSRFRPTSCGNVRKCMVSVVLCGSRGWRGWRLVRMWAQWVNDESMKTYGSVACGINMYAGVRFECNRRVLSFDTAAGAS